MTDKLNAALRVALKDPECIKREEGLGAVVVTDARLAAPNTRSSSRPRSPSGARSSRRRGNTPIDAAAPAETPQARNVIGIVTGPSLTRLTCMSAPNSPLATGACSRRAVATTRS